MSASDPLRQPIETAGSAAAYSAAGQSWPWRFARCWMYVDRVQHGGEAEKDLAAAYDEFGLVPSDAPGRPRLAAALLEAHVRSGILDHQLDRARSLVAVVDQDPAPPAHWPATRAVVRGR